MIDDTLVYFGDAVKALGSGRVGGLVVPYGSPAALDADGEYFHAGTDYGLHVSTKARVLYHHGATKAFGKRQLFVADLGTAEAGIEGGGQLDMGRAEDRDLYAEAEAGRLYWSSGSASHLVVKTPVKGGVRIDSWPIIEVSLTPNPVNRRARAVALKALFDESGDEGAAAAPSLLDDLQRLATDAREYVPRVERAVKARGAEGRPLSPAKRDALKAVADELLALWRASKPGPTREEIRALRVALLRQELAQIGD